LAARLADACAITSIRDTRAIAIAPEGGLVEKVVRVVLSTIGTRNGGRRKT
jgi:hypothetical protein